MSMKLWELDSILSANNGYTRELPTKIASSKEEWRYLVTMFSNIYNQRDRGILDAELPPEFVIEVLEKSEIVCYKYNDGTLRSYKSDKAEVVSAVDVYMKYGGYLLERLFERSCVGDISDDFEARKILGT